MTVDARAALEAVWRLESPHIIAALARLVRDLGLAEDLAQDAFVMALERWPESGVPPNPGAWLMIRAKHRAIDRLRRDGRLARKLAALARDAAEDERFAVHEGPSEYDEVVDDELEDDLLRLIFTACHPVLSQDARVALTLRVVSGLRTEEIARAFLVPEPTVAQRVVRAKRTLADRRVPFEIPPPADRVERLASVLEVVYLIFNEGYTATAGEDWTRPELCHEALRLGRLLAQLAPTEAEVHGLVALMELQASRTRARLGPDGAPIPLLEQNRGLWDRLLVRRGFAALLRAERTGRRPGAYVLQAAIAACHAGARTAEDTDWARIVSLYDNLYRITPSPVVELNRAVAVSFADSPEKALQTVDRLAGAPALRGYHLLPSVRADLLLKLGRTDEAITELNRALEQTKNDRERAVLHNRLDAAGRRGTRTAD
jgi:RNA polymerase sigma factor (sigma-70 family)